MDYRSLGSTGLQVSVLAFGGATLGSVFGPVSEESAVESVHEAVRLGINFFDVSPYYGDTLAEKNLGKALKTVREESGTPARAGR